MRIDLLDVICAFLRDTHHVDANVVVTVRARIAKQPDPVGEAFNAQRATLIAWVPATDTFLSGFTELIGFIGTTYVGLATPGDRVDWLLRFNALFHSSVVHAKSVRRGVAPQVVIDTVAMLENTGVAAQPGFLAYTAAHGADSFNMLWLTYEKWRADGRVEGDLYLLIELLRRHLAPLDTLTPATCLDIRKLSATNPPGGPFRGFGSWGKGNHGSIAANVENHFRKHVLNAFGESLKDPSECAVWWSKLDIRVPIAAMDNVPDTPLKRLAVGLFRDGFLQQTRNPLFLRHMRDEMLRDGSALTQWLSAHYKAKYKDDTLGMSVRMLHGAVFFENGAVYVSGTVEHEFSPYYIVGRVDEGVVTISSCYVATDIDAKLAARQVLWLFV